ncbi:hypothetical protein V3C99_009596 [Haemonchus contortus]
MNLIALVVLLCVTYSVTEKCAHNRQIDYKKFNELQKSFPIPPEVYRKDYDNDDLVLEFDMYFPSKMGVENMTYPFSIIISREKRPSTFLVYDASRTTVVELSGEQFIAFLHIC